MAGSDLDVVTVALAQMAAFRGAEPAGPTLALFARRLLAEGCEASVIVGACHRLEVAERKDGESAFPSLGTLLRVCREVSGERHREQVAREQRRYLDSYAEQACASMSPEDAHALIVRLRASVAERVARS